MNSKLKSSFILDILGKDFDIYRERIDFQMTPEMNWSNKESDQVKPIFMLDLYNKDEIKEAFTWKNTQSLPKKIIKIMGVILIL